MFSFSPDGLCQEALDVLGKQETEEDILKAARLAASRDALSVYHFMVNVPGENERTVKKVCRCWRGSMNSMLPKKSGHDSAQQYPHYARHSDREDRQGRGGSHSRY